MQQSWTLLTWLLGSQIIILIIFFLSSFFPSFFLNDGDLFSQVGEKYYFYPPQWSALVTRMSGIIRVHRAVALN